MIFKDRPGPVVSQVIPKHPLDPTQHGNRVQPRQPISLGVCITADGRAPLVTGPSHLRKPNRLVVTVKVPNLTQQLRIRHIPIRLN